MIYAIALSPDGKLLASGGFLETGYGADYNYIRIHDFHSEELLQILKGHENVVNDLAFSPGGRWLASASQDNTVRLWKRSGSRFTSGPVLQGHERHVYAVRLLRTKDVCGWSALAMTTPSASGMQIQEGSLHSEGMRTWQTPLQWDPTGSQAAVGTRQSVSGIIH